MQKETNAMEDLFSKTTDYLETRAELLKLSTTEKASDLISSIVSRVVIGITGLLVVVLFNLGLAIWLGRITGELYLGFFIVTGFYLLLLLVLYFGRLQLLKDPAKNAIIKKMFN